MTKYGVGEQILTTVPPFVVTEVLLSALLRRGYSGTDRCVSKLDVEGSKWRLVLKKNTTILSFKRESKFF